MKFFLLKILLRFNELRTTGITFSDKLGIVSREWEQKKKERHEKVAL
jgi:hypothetical protein